MKSNDRKAINLRFDRLASIILQINALTCIRSHLDVLKYKYSSNACTKVQGIPSHLIAYIQNSEKIHYIRKQAY